ncbi:hypothetical protein AB0G87_17105 [Streptomyces asoensis]
MQPDVDHAFPAQVVLRADSLLLDAVVDKQGVVSGPGIGKTVWFECAPR